MSSISGMGAGAVDRTSIASDCPAPAAVETAGASIQIEGLGFGARGPEVQALQDNLSAVGFHAGAPDGVFGRQTEKALLAFQKAMGLPTTGRADAGTTARLSAEVAKLPTAEIRHKDEDGMAGPLSAIVNGKEQHLADEAIMSFPLDNGRLIAWTGYDGAGGFENEGQSLRVFDPATGESKKVLSEYYMISEVTTARSGDGETALLVGMQDGGLGAPHFAVVDPDRGEVFRMQMAEVVEVRGDKVKVGVYDDESAVEAGKPSRFETISLKEVLKGDVINLKNEFGISYAEGVRLENPDQWGPQPLYATIDGEEKKLTDEALKGFTLDDGAFVAWSGLDGAGGFENEGQSLYVHDVASGETKKVLSEYYMVDDVTFARTKQGGNAMLVQMSDGGVGASHFAVVDPLRGGEVFRLEQAKLVKQDGDKVTLAIYKNPDDERPTSFRTFDIEKLLSGPVITNPRQPME